MSVRVLAASICVIAAAASVLAQPQATPQPGRAPAPRAGTEQPAPPPPAPAVAVVPRREGQPVNVTAIGPVPLNVDTSPELLTDGKIRLAFNLQYDWPAPLDAPDRTPRGTVIKTTMHDSVSLILENGKSMIAAQSADPIGDRQVTVEVKATILR